MVGFGGKITEYKLSDAPCSAILESLILNDSPAEFSNCYMETLFLFSFSCMHKDTTFIICLISSTFVSYTEYVLSLVLSTCIARVPLLV